MPDSVIHALLGKEPGALRPDVSLATPLTLPRIVGRDQVLNALTSYAGVLGATDATSGFMERSWRALCSPRRSTGTALRFSPS